MSLIDCIFMCNNCLNTNNHLIYRGGGGGGGGGGWGIIVYGQKSGHENPEKNSSPEI